MLELSGYRKSLRMELIMEECDVTVSELFQAYYDCRKHKRKTPNALKFEQNLERNLMDLYYDLHNDTYEIGKSICFVVQYPKIREVWAADFRDRIVHHLLYNKIKDRFHNRFIHDSYACIPNKGVLAAVKRVEHFMRSESDNYSKDTYYMKADVQNFFVSINKPILDTLLTKRITESWWLKLTRKILYHDPTTNYEKRSSKHLFNKIPSHKSLFNANGTGLPIGNLSSQFFANVYLDSLDQYTKHFLKQRSYIRYVDDVVIISNSNSLLSIFKYMDCFLKEKLKLRFHPNKLEINFINKGINYLGYIIKPFVKYVRRMTIANAVSKIKKNNTITNTRNIVNSYLGMFRHCNCFKQKTNMINIIDTTLFTIDENLYKINMKECRV